MTTLNGLPAHILLVHAIVVLLPLTALVLVATAVWPAARRKLAGANAVLAVLTLALVPVTTSAGEWLQERVPETDLVTNHAELGDTALYVAVPVALVAVLIWWRGREHDRHVHISSRPPDEPAGARSPGGHTAVATPRATAPRMAFLAPASTAVTTLVATAAVLAAGAALYDTYLIGDSGARATWQDRTGAPTPGQGSESTDGG